MDDSQASFTVFSRMSMGRPTSRAWQVHPLVRFLSIFLCPSTRGRSKRHHPRLAVNTVVFRPLAPKSQSGGACIDTFYFLGVKSP